MRHPNDSDFAERRKTAMEAKARLLKQRETAPKPDDPAVLAKRAEREAVAAARTTRQAERDRLKRETTERQQAEAAARHAAEASAKAEAGAQEESQQFERLAAKVEADKIERDRRYAARKARQR